MILYDRSLRGAAILQSPTKQLACARAQKNPWKKHDGVDPWVSPVRASAHQSPSSAAVGEGTRGGDPVG